MPAKRSRPVIFRQVRAHQPLIHHISNWVTLHDCANAAYAIGARPTMAFDPDEAAIAAGQADAVVWNLGTFNDQSRAAIQAALPIVASRPIPVVIDPVAAQAYPGRLLFLLDCLDQFAQLAAQDSLACSLIIRGNASELSALIQKDPPSGPRIGGVDLTLEQKSNPVPFRAKLSLYQQFFATFPANMPLLLVETGKTDGVCFLINGQVQVLEQTGSCPELTRITGAGCMSNTLIAGVTGALLKVNSQSSRVELAQAALTAVTALVEAGQMAAAQAPGIGTFRALLFDELGRMDPI